MSRTHHTRLKDADGDEATPLLSKTNVAAHQPPWPKSVVYRALCAAYLVSLSFGVTQVPLLFAFGEMSCDEYYRRHAAPPAGSPEWDARCKLNVIGANTARAFALMGVGTTVFGVANLFITGWLIKVFGVKMALLISVFWPAVRLLIQNIGVTTGYELGIIILQASQITTIFGGPAGYILALNSFVAEVVLPVDRTASLGRVSGVTMFGTATGFLAGGIIGDQFGMRTPFRVTLLLFCISTAFAAFALPSIPTSPEVANKASKSLGAFFEPLKTFKPRKWRLANGVVRREYGNLLLGAGAFTAVLATGFIPTLLQLYSIDMFDFSSTENSALTSLNFVIRAGFLTFAFPVIIHRGRAWMKRKEKAKRIAARQLTHRRDNAPPQYDEVGGLPVDASELASTALPAGQAHADEPDQPVPQVEHSSDGIEDDDSTEESYEFDLLYTRYSLLADGLLTILATFVMQGWQLYVVAGMLPLAAGTAAAAKGTMLQMCTPEQRTDALSAISLIESIARLSTVSLFGVIFAAFVDVGQPRWTFLVNAAVAVCGFVILLSARFPPAGAVRYVEGGEGPNDDTDEAAGQ